MALDAFQLGCELIALALERLASLIGLLQPIPRRLPLPASAFGIALGLLDRPAGIFPLSVETGEWGTEVTNFAPGATYTHVFTKPGVYAYYCSIHGSAQAGMTGTITVKP